MESVKILHCADIHLGSDFRVLGRKAVTRRADLKNTFLNIVNIAKEEKVDLFLAVGDIFESWTVPEDNFLLARDAFESIPETKVVIAAGNHDPLSYDSPYLREGFWSENVHILPPVFSSILFEDIGVELWGASFSSIYQQNPLLKKASPTRKDFIQIGVIHGMVGTAGQPSPYNPIAIGEIGDSGLDYLALGHIHKSTGVLKEKDTYYAYPGCPEGRGFDELGEKGVLLGAVSKKKCDIKLLPTCKREYQEVHVDLTDSTGSHDASIIIDKALSSGFQTHYEENLYKIFLVGKIDASVNLNLESIKGYLENLFYIKLRDHTQLDIDLESVAKEMTLRGVFVRRMLEMMESDDSPKLQDALKLGLKSFSGEVNYSED